MRLFAFFLVSTLLFYSTDLAAQDADTYEAALESVDTTASCMDACARQYEFCVSSATIPTCIANVPECANLAPRTTEIMAAFCEACGRATAGCAGEEPAPSPVTESPSTSEESSASSPARESRPRRRISSAERERSEASQAQTNCERARGIWDPEASILMPDGSGRIGICRTPESVELSRMISAEHDARISAIDDLEAYFNDSLDEHITADEAAEAALRRRDLEHDELIFQMMRVTERLEAERRCLALGAREVRYESSLPVLHRDIPVGMPNRWEDVGARVVRHECDTRRTSEEVLETESSASEDASSEPSARSVEETLSTEDSEEARRPEDHPTIGGVGSSLHLRVQMLSGLFFTPLHPVLAIQRGEANALPLSLGIDITLYGPLAGGWYAEGGAGLSYDAPDVPLFATNARLWYHAGLRAFIQPIISIGFGYLGSDRFQSTLQSVHSFHGGYLDLSAHLHFRFSNGSLESSGDVTDPSVVFTLRGGAGASFRASAPQQADGLLQLLTGVEF